LAYAKKYKKGASMPRGDRTGPEGRGAMTGRGMGLCGGYSSPGFSRGGRLGGGRGFGHGFAGRGLGRGRMNYYAPVSYRDDRYQDDHESVKSLKDEISSVEQYLKELKEIVEKKEQDAN